MAYVSDNREDLLIDVDGTKDNHTIVKSISNKDGEFIAIDLRNYFTNDNGQLIPTKRGIRIKEENLAEVLSSILVNLPTELKMDIEHHCNGEVSFD